MRRKLWGVLVPEMLRSLIHRPVTEPYPSVKVAVPPGFRGKVEIESQLCIGCSKCALVCPTQCIDMVPEERQVSFRGKTIARRKKPEVRLLDCIRCGLCEEVCPPDPKAIFLTTEFSGSTETKELVSR